KEYSLENQQRLDKVEEEYLMAKAMDEIQTNIKGLIIEEGIIKKDLTLDEVINLEEQIREFQEKVVYYDRNQTTLADAKEQVNVIQTAKSYIDDLFEEDSVRVDVTRENEEEALELIQKIKNEEAREEILARAEMINLAIEEAVAEEEAAAQQALEEAEELEETSEQTEWQPNQSETWNNSGNTGNTSNTNNTSNWRPPSNSSGSETTSQGNSQPSNPLSEETTNEAEDEETDTSSEVEPEPEEPPAEQEEDTNEEQ